MHDQPAFDPNRFQSIEEQERWFAALARTVAVDYDGVIHPYTDGWVGAVPADEPPMPGAEDFLSALVALDYRIVIFSTRCIEPDGLAGVTAWLDRYGLSEYIDEVTCVKPPAVAYVDDRAVPFTGPSSWPDVLTHVSRLAEGRSHGAAEAPHA